MSPLLFLERLIRDGCVAVGDVPANGESWGLHHAVGRLAGALNAGGFGLDQAVLLRQCLRLLGPGQAVVLEKVAPDVEYYFETVGLRRRINGTIEAIPYVPSWLRVAAPQGIDVPATNCVLDDDSMPGEAWLVARLGKQAWRSQAQREAAWEALTAPPNSTLLVGLPTGAGKSLVYQVCAAFEPGLTVVVVPTVALGLDQIKSLCAMPLAETHKPMLYTADANAISVLAAVRAKECRLLVTSPEAIVAGRLGPVLAAHIEDGWLTRLVVDEAHIVESWGASFRVEFQLLGACLRRWRDRAPLGVRTLLLSGTFGPGTTGTLKTLFAGASVPWEEYVIQRLRPEIHYFSPGGPLSEQAHETAVIEALLHLPRPAILYLTERAQAESWDGRLRAIGLKRLECFHGETAQSDRDRILNAWREDRLDLVVATSAFGMGVDKPDVRSVMHACFPENIDRYYQEVGRGARDGAPSSAVALWTEKDRAIGGSMGPRLLADEVKIRERWAAMWKNRGEATAPGVFRVPLWVSPNYMMHTRTYEESVTWNKRLLLMMERAGVLQIVGMDIESDEDSKERREWATLHMLRSTYDLDMQLPSLLQQTRAEELAVLGAGRERLDRFLANTEPACRILREHYGRSTYRTCGSCACCRVTPEIRAGTTPLVLRLERPTTAPLIDIVYGPSTSNNRDEGEIVMALRRVIQENVSRHFVAGAHFYERARSLLEIAAAHGDVIYRLDLLGPEMARSVCANEIVVCLHDRNIHPQAAVLHTRGAVCSHWILGAPMEDRITQWPFLHLSESRPFFGQHAIDKWINVRRASRPDSERLSSVH
jgi:ATP-dependent DNA helicase RecQ